MSASAHRLRGLSWRALLLSALVLSAALYASTLPGKSLLMDFRGGLYDAGRAIVHGHDPYQAGFLAHQAAIMRAGGLAGGETLVNDFSVPLYPAPINVAVVPLSVLPLWLAGSLFTLLSLTAITLGLRLLGLRDWRCFALVLVSWPLAFSLYVGALGPLLVLGAGIVWRWRDRLWSPAIATAAVIVAKLFPWPIAVWLAITRRWRTLALALAIGCAATLLAWAAIGFAGMSQYLQMLSNASFIQERRADSLVAVLLAAGVPAGLATALAFAAAGSLLALAWRVARRPEGECAAFALAILAALTASPLVWEHYMVLLFIPLALIVPRLSALWLAPLCSPLVLVISEALVPMSGPVRPSDQHTLRGAVLWLAIEAVLVARACRSGNASSSLTAAGRRRAAPSLAEIAA